MRSTPSVVTVSDILDIHRAERPVGQPQRVFAGAAVDDAAIRLEQDVVVAAVTVEFVAAVVGDAGEVRVGDPTLDRRQEELHVPAHQQVVAVVTDYVVVVVAADQFVVGPRAIDIQLGGSANAVVDVRSDIAVIDRAATKFDVVRIEEAVQVADASTSRCRQARVCAVPVVTGASVGRSRSCPPFFELI